MPDLPEDLFRLVAEESEAQVPAPIIAVAEAARLRHEQAIVAVLLYGSCLRQRSEEGKIVDLYLLAGHYKDAHSSRIARAVNALLPPNVYYVESLFDGRRVTAKYAIVTLAQFEALVAPRTLQPYFWARFAQPTVILWTRDDADPPPGACCPRPVRDDDGWRDSGAHVRGLDPGRALVAGLYRNLPHRIPSRGGRSGAPAV